MPSNEIKPIEIDLLLLDEENPRLPEDLQGASEEEILRFMYEHAVLEELAQSFVESGFFASEPLTVFKKRQKYVVLEGNRRLATLLFLHQKRTPADLRLDVAADAAQLSRLSSIPCHIVRDRSDVDSIIGYRHIGGLKKWSAESKARWIKQHIDQLAAEGVDDPFRELGRKIGSNSQGMRNPYIAITVLHAARSNGISEANQIVSERRFGVWQRAMNSRDIRDHINFPSASTHAAIHAAVEELDLDTLSHVIGDFVSRGTVRPLLSDSRNITEYGQILRDERAHDILRTRGDFDLARQVVAQLALPQRIRDLIARVKLVREDLEQADDMSDEVSPAVGELFKMVRGMRTYVQSLEDD